MAGTKLTPEKITSPFQLMAAWFAMLVLLVSVLLTAAVNIKHPDWAAGYLVIFASTTVLSVFICVTLMLTVFRPHLQDGREYAQWLKDSNRYSKGLVRSEQISPPPKLSQKTTLPPLNRANTRALVSALPGKDLVINELKRIGYDAAVYMESDPGEMTDQESIWIGYAVPAAAAVETIKIAVKIWPHLKYMHLSIDGALPPDEVHFEMYFGGATSTAKEYNLKKWATEELLNLDHAISTEDFHKLIRSRYP